MSLSIITLSIPIFFVLIAVELGYSFFKKLGYYRLNDSLSNLSQGAGQQIVDIFMKSTIFLSYIYIYEHWRFFDIPNLWYVWILLFIGVDFFYYWFHRMSHQVNALWAAHIVHHQSEEYNLTVALRQSWIQGWFSWIFYIPLAIFGFEPLMFLSVSALVTVYQFWIHTKSIKNMGFLEYILNTPSHHRVHHGSNAKYIDKNHAGTFIIWDKLFGTFQKEDEEVIYGITSPLNSWNPLWANLHYWKELRDQARGMQRFGDKLRVFYKPPGWKPEESVATVAQLQLKSTEKYDPVFKQRYLPYVLFQFSLGLMGGVTLLFFQNQLSSTQLVWFACFAIASLVSSGALLENKRWVPYFEYGRWAITTAILYFSGLGENYFFYIAIFISLNLIWFRLTSHK